MAMHHTSVVSLRSRGLCKCAFDAIIDEEEALECDLQPRLAVEFLSPCANPGKTQTHTHMEHVRKTCVIWMLFSLHLLLVQYETRN